MKKLAKKLKEKDAYIIKFIRLNKKQREINHVKHDLFKLKIERRDLYEQAVSNGAI